MKTIQVALIQQAFHTTREQTLQHTKEAILEASRNGAELILLQELHTREYFCQSEDVKFFDYASCFQEEVEFFASLAQKTSAVIVASLFERRCAGIYHNTAVVFEKDGHIAGQYRKMHIPDDPAFYEKFYFTMGDLGFEPIETSLGKLGVMVCWDQWFPESARIMTLKGADMLIYPTAIGWFPSDLEEEKTRQRDAWIAVQRGHAIANGIPTLAINRIGIEKDSKIASQEIHFWGSSFAFGPQGEFLGMASIEKEEILYVEIDLARSEEVRKIWPFLRDRRIDCYSEILKRYCD